MTRFVIDTVFVVGDFVDHTAADQRQKLEGRISDTYRTVTIDPWYRGPLPEGQSHRLYVGATPERSVGKMFSFFPCQPHAEDGRGFGRPEIQIPGRITNHLTQGKKIARDLTMEELGDLWRRVAEQVEDQGLSLGVHADLPQKRREGRRRAEDSDSLGRC